MKQEMDLTGGRILPSLLRFALPVLLALFLQSMYGAVDLLVVGKFAEPADVSAVSTGSMLMMTLTNIVSGLGMGMTVLLGQKIGEKRIGEGNRIIGGGVYLFLWMGLALTAAVTAGAGPLAGIMQAPPEALSRTEAYIRICGAGSLSIISYNLIGSVFRGLGDSRTPLFTVAVASGCNIAGDLLLVAVFSLGAAGAAIATVLAQLVSVLLSLILIRKKRLPVTLERGAFRWNGAVVRRILGLGVPIALQDFLVGISFLVVQAIVNTLGVTASAAVGVGEKVCGFLMLVPSAFMQSMSAFVAQNRGAGRMDRAVKGLRYAIGASAVVSLVMAYLSYYHGDLLSWLFARDGEVIAAAADYLRAYALDCLLTCFLFCFIGFFNGMEQTGFVMVQGLIGAFLVRVPLCFRFVRWEPVSLFRVGLATPASSLVQILLCFGYLAYIRKRRSGRKEGSE